MIRMLIVGYVFAIRSERQICREVQVNLAYRWFCGLGLEDSIPDHSVFSRARNERFRESEVSRRVFERVVASCITAGLVGGEGFAVDASLIEADANRQRSIPGKDWDRKRAPDRARRAVKEYLATLDDAAFGAASEVVPKFISRSDPAAQWTGALKGPAFFAYANNYLIDVKVGIIVDVEATRAIRQGEVEAAKTMIDRTEERFGLKPERLAGDTAYGSGANLDWLVNEAKIAPHIPVIDKSKREDGTFSREDFRFERPDLVGSTACDLECEQQVLSEAASHLLSWHFEGRPVVGSAGCDHHVVDRGWEIMEERLQGDRIVGVEGPGALRAKFDRRLLEAFGVASGEDDAGTLGAGSPGGFQPYAGAATDDENGLTK